MTSVDAETAACRFASRFDERGDRRFAVGGVVLRVGFGVKFHAVGSGFGCGRDHFGPCVDEYRGANAGGFEPGDHFFQKGFVRDGIPAGVRRDRVVRVGHQRYLGRADIEYQIDETVDRVSFDVEFGRKHRFQVVDVPVADVSFIRPRVHGDPLGAEPFGVQRRFDDVRNVPPAGIAQGGDLIYVNA